MKEIRFYLRNIGGLRGELELTFKEGVNVLIAGNAEGKTSVIRGLKSLLTSEYDDSIINQFEDSCEVRLTIDNMTFSKALRKRDGEILIEENKTLPNGSLIESVAFVDLNKLKLLELDRGAIVDTIKRVSGLDEYEKEIRVKQEECAKLESEVKRLDYEIAGLGYVVGRMKEYEKEAEDVRTRLNQVKIELERHRESVTVADQIDQALEEALKVLREKEDRIEGLRTKKSKIEANIERVSRRISDIKVEISKAPPNLEEEKTKREKELKEVEQNMDIIDAEINMLDAARKLPLEENKCPLCQQQVSVDTLKTTINEQMKILTDMKNSLTSKKRMLKAELGKIKEEIEKIDRLSKELKEKEEELKRLRDEREHVLSEMRKAESEFEKAEKEYIRLKDKVPKIKELLVDKTLYERRLEELTKEMKRLKSDANKYQELTSRREKLHEEVERLKQELEVREREFKDKFGRFLDSFNKEINLLLSEMKLMNISRVSLSEDGSIIVKRDEDKEASPEQLSRSEKVTIGVVLMTSLYSTFVKETFPLFVIDELAEFYDADRFKALVSYLSRKVPCLLVTVLSKGKPLELVYGINHVSELLK